MVKKYFNMSIRAGVIVDQILEIDCDPFLIKMEKEFEVFHYKIYKSA